MGGVGIAQEAHAQTWISRDDGCQLLEVVRCRKIGHRPDSTQAGLGYGAGRSRSRPQEELALEHVETQPPADLEGPAAVHSGRHQFPPTHALTHRSDELREPVGGVSPDLDNHRLDPVEQRPVRGAEVDSIQRQPEASHGVTVDGVPHVAVDGLRDPEKEDDAIGRK
jgi:hypothetical protein